MAAALAAVAMSVFAPAEWAIVDDQQPPGAARGDDRRGAVLGQWQAAVAHDHARGGREAGVTRAEGGGDYEAKGYQPKGADVGRVSGSAATAAKARAFAEGLRPVLTELARLSANAAAKELARRGYATAAGGTWTAGKSPCANG